MLPGEFEVPITPLLDAVENRYAEMNNNLNSLEHKNENLHEELTQSSEIFVAKTFSLSTF